MKRSGLVAALMFLPLTIVGVRNLGSDGNVASSVEENDNEVLYHETAPDEEGNIENDYDPSVQSTDFSSEVYSGTTPLIDVYKDGGELMKNYYRHLDANKISNSMGNCGYTAIGMLLSYFDTYWNDNFIEEKYEASVTEVASTELLDYSSSYESPGIKDTMAGRPSKKSLQNAAKAISGVDSEGKPIQPAYNIEFDILLMKIVLEEIDSDSFMGKLLQIAIDTEQLTPHFTIESYYLDDRSAYVPRTYSDGSSEHYVKGLGVNNKFTNTVLAAYLNQNQFLKDDVKIVTSKIKTGLDKSTESKRIYTEVSNIVKTGKPVLMGAQRYEDENGNGVYDKEEEEPTFGHVFIAYEYDEATGKLYGNRGWGLADSHFDIAATYNLEFSDYWTFELSSSLGRNYSNHYFLTDSERYYSPYQNLKATVAFAPDQYGFADAYPVDDDTATTYQLHDVLKNFEFNTRRYRTGYIHNEYVVMSCMRSGITEAWIEYMTRDPIYGIYVDLSHWRSFAQDWLDSTTATAVLQIYGKQDVQNPYEKGGWFNYADLLSSEINLSRDRNAQTKYFFEFNQPITQFKFYCKSKTEHTNDNNRGRLCIGDIQFVTNRDSAYL